MCNMVYLFLLANLYQFICFQLNQHHDQKIAEQSNCDLRAELRSDKPTNSRSYDDNIEVSFSCSTACVEIVTPGIYLSQNSSLVGELITKNSPGIIYTRSAQREENLFVFLAVANISALFPRGSALECMFRPFDSGTFKPNGKEYTAKVDVNQALWNVTKYTTESILKGTLNSSTESKKDITEATSTSTHAPVTNTTELIEDGQKGDIRRLVIIIGNAVGILLLLVVAAIIWMLKEHNKNAKEMRIAIHDSRRNFPVSTQSFDRARSSYTNQRSSRKSSKNQKWGKNRGSSGGHRQNRKS